MNQNALNIFKKYKIIKASLFYKNMEVSKAN